jgi:hypothetical protein
VHNPSEPNGNVLYSFTFSYTVEDALALENYMGGARRPRGSAGVQLAAGVILLGVFWGFFTDIRDLGPDAVFSFSYRLRFVTRYWPLLLGAPILCVLIHRVFRKALIAVLEMRQNREAPVTLSVCEDGIELTADGISRRTQWKDVAGIAEQANHFVVALDSRSGYVFPKRVFASDEERGEVLQRIKALINAGGERTRASG